MHVTISVHTCIQIHVYTCNYIHVHCVYMYVCTMFCRGDQLGLSHQLLYYIMTLLKSCTDKSFEIVIDLTQATHLNEPDVRFFQGVFLHVHIYVSFNILVLFFVVCIVTCSFANTFASPPFTSQGNKCSMYMQQDGPWDDWCV